jgi:uncharacterized MAPEG superfamily protein
MTIELTLLVWASLLGLVHLLLTVPFTIGQLGLGYVFGPRDPQTVSTGYVARFDRAFANFLQTFPCLAATVLAAAVAGKHSSLTILGAQLYLAARLIYIPLYVIGTPVLRTLAWLASITGIGLILGALV